MSEEQRRRNQAPLVPDSANVVVGRRDGNITTTTTETNKQWDSMQPSERQPDVTDSTVFVLVYSPSQIRVNVTHWNRWSVSQRCPAANSSLAKASISSRSLAPSFEHGRLRS